MVLGPRFLIEAGFIVAVAVVAGIERVGTWEIILLVAAAWLLVAAVELVLWARQAKVRPAPVSAPSAPDPEPGPRVIVRPEPRVVPAPSPPPPSAEPEPEVQAEPEPEPKPEPESEPEPTVAYLPPPAEPREWNLWELERVVREHATDDVARNEERAYLLMYLREFAGPDGTLPADFDGLVRDAFGDLLRVAAL
ncbi:MAG: hypothetical protein ACJ74A_06690 [Gaiellaceae bacterium]